jgi:predicted NUDIX family phosphoesterase
MTTATYNKMDEIILVVPRLELFNYEKHTFQGAESRKPQVHHLNTVLNQHYTSMRRGDAEEDFNFKQPIPYALIRRGDSIFVYERLSGGGETRLHGKLSLGVGGHMNPLSEEMDDAFEDVLEENLKRELEEEIEIVADSSTTKIVGFINDETNAVGRVHIGVLAVIDLPDLSEVTVRETEQLRGRWMTLEELKQEDVYSRLENWSKIAVDSL